MLSFHPRLHSDQATGLTSSDDPPMCTSSSLGRQVRVFFLGAYRRHPVDPQFDQALDDLIAQFVRLDRVQLYSMGAAGLEVGF